MYPYKKQAGELPNWESVITNAGKLKAKFVIHTVGPVWNNGNNNEIEKLSNCYKNTLNLAFQKEVKSISFPNISTGIYRFPKDKAAEIAISTVIDFVKHNESMYRIQFVCNDDENYDVYKEILNEVFL